MSHWHELVTLLIPFVPLLTAGREPGDRRDVPQVLIRKNR